LLLPYYRDRLGLSVGDLYAMTYADLCRELAYADGKALAQWCAEHDFKPPELPRGQ